MMERDMKLAACTTALLLAGVPEAHAQSIGKTAPAVMADDPEYEPKGTNVGPFVMFGGVDAGVNYDSNVYAVSKTSTNRGPIDDAIFEIAPQLDINYAGEKLSFRGHADALIKRYVDQTTQDSEAAGVLGELKWSPSRGHSLTALGTWNRDVEDRGDPEANVGARIGPRIYNILAGSLIYAHTGTRISFNAEAAARKTNALASEDSDRDFTTWLGRGTVGYRVSGTMSVTGTGFINRRNFRIKSNATLTDRDTTTYGARLGVEFDPGGLFAGNVSAGVFKLNPADPTLSSRTGFSAAGAVTYRPSRRTAITADVFNGDVATFRSGATSRTDTTAKLTLQQEIRHNLFANVGAGYRHTKYVGNGLKESTLIGFGEVEYLLNRNWSVAANVNYGTRDSDNPTDEFNRFRGGVEVRFQF
jgi:hypothetical protein